MALTAAEKKRVNQSNKLFRELNLGDRMVVDESSNADVLDTPLTGFVTTDSGTIVATDTIVEAMGKAQAQIDDIVTDILGTDLTGFASNNAVIVETDNVLEAIGKAQGQISDLSTAKLTSIAGDIIAGQIAGEIVTIDLGAVYTVMSIYAKTALGVIKPVTKVENLTGADETKIAFTVTGVVATDKYYAILKAVA